MSTVRLRNLYIQSIVYVLISSWEGLQWIVVYIYVRDLYQISPFFLRMGAAYGE